MTEIGDNFIKINKYQHSFSLICSTFRGIIILIAHEEKRDTCEERQITE